MLQSNKKVLFHQTKREYADLILRSLMFKPGSRGLAGGGIYFAESPPATKLKCHAGGVILQATVLLGRLKHIRHHYTGGTPSTASITGVSLQAEGFDSVHLSGLHTGDEWIVYFTDQVDQGSIMELKTWQGKDIKEFLNMQKA